MTTPRPSRLATLTAAAALIVVAAGLATGCERQVVRETGYSSQQFPQYQNLPRTGWQSDPQEEQPSVVEEIGTDIGKGFGKLFKGIGNLNPWKKGA